MAPIYLDNNSTTPCDPAVVEAMLPFLNRDYGNPDSQHVLGRRAATAVEHAREQVARLVGCASSEIVFTSGATESNNIVILGLMESGLCSHSGIVTSAIEHMAVLRPCARLEAAGVRVTRARVDSSGVIDRMAFRAALEPETTLVSIQAANNEVGVLQPLSDIAKDARAAKSYIHTDAAQALGKIPFSVADLDLDFASFSAHKLCGPKGIGALYVRGGCRKALSPVLHGGGHEGGVRPGTLNVAAIVGFGVACTIAGAVMEEERLRLSRLRSVIEGELLAHVPGLSINGADAPRLPGTTSITIQGVPSDMMIANLPGVCVGNGAACTSGALSPSHVLVAMGLSREEAHCTLRVSLGRDNREVDVREAVVMIKDAAIRLLRILQ